MHKRNTNNVYAVILVGGKGKRLRPLSTDLKPKAFLSVMKDGGTMLNATVKRTKKIIPQDHIFVAANKKHSHLVKKDFPVVDERRLVLEPVSRNSGPAVILAALRLKKMFGDVIVIALPTDQYVFNEKKYLDSVRRCIEFIEENPQTILIMGVRPTSPATGFGYIKIGGRGPGAANRNIFKVERFVEKPDVGTAKKYMKNGDYLWNAGTFIFRVSTILAAAKKFVPKIYNGLSDLSKAELRYKGLPDISIDFAIMERADNIYCLESSYRWLDMGSYDTIKTILKRESRDFIMKNGRITKIL